MLQQKRGVLVDKMQQELESLQLELSQLQCMMPGAYTTGS
jgi:hypothetical protein